MCGFAGLLKTSGDTRSETLCGAVQGMAETVRHRGPDDSGVWVDPAVGVALGFRRLAILDLTEAGHQPMLSRDGQLVLVFNGEIYNHDELRAELTSSAGDRQW